MSENLDQLTTPSAFQFSAVSLDSLGAAEYTLATIVLDMSGSVASYVSSLKKSVDTIIKSCRKSPRSENIMLRIVTFNSSVKEILGFVPVNNIDLSKIKIGSTEGMTALNDALISAIESSNEYAKMLAEQDYMVNGVTYVITDGCDNASNFDKKKVKVAISNATDGKNLESYSVILIGLVGNSIGNTGVSKELNSYMKDVEITQYVDLLKILGESSPENALAKLAGLISKSISTTSQALSSGTPASVAAQSSTLLF